MGTDHQERGVALVALGIEVYRVYGLEVGILVAFPCENAVVVGKNREETVFAKAEQGTGLCAVTAAHVVVAVNNVVMIGEASTKKNTVEEYTLLKTCEVSYAWETAYKTGTRRGCLTDTVGHKA